MRGAAVSTPDTAGVCGETTVLAGEVFSAVNSALTAYTTGVGVSLSGRAALATLVDNIGRLGVATGGALPIWTAVGVAAGAPERVGDADVGGAGEAGTLVSVATMAVMSRMPGPTGRMVLAAFGS